MTGHRLVSALFFLVIFHLSQSLDEIIDSEDWGEDWGRKIGKFGNPVRFGFKGKKRTTHVDITPQNKPHSRKFPPKRFFTDFGNSEKEISGHATNPVHRWPTPGNEKGNLPFESNRLNNLQQGAQEQGRFVQNSPKNRFGTTFHQRSNLRKPPPKTFFSHFENNKKETRPQHKWPTPGVEEGSLLIMKKHFRNPNRANVFLNIEQKVPEQNTFVPNPSKSYIDTASPQFQFTKNENFAFTTGSINDKPHVKTVSFDDVNTFTENFEAQVQTNTPAGEEKPEETLHQQSIDDAKSFNNYQREEHVSENFRENIFNGQVLITDNKSVIGVQEQMEIPVTNSGTIYKSLPSPERDAQIKIEASDLESNHGELEQQLRNSEHTISPQLRGNNYRNEDTVVKKRITESVAIKGELEQQLRNSEHTISPQPQDNYRNEDIVVKRRITESGATKGLISSRLQEDIPPTNDDNRGSTINFPDRLVTHGAPLYHNEGDDSDSNQQSESGLLENNQSSFLSGSKQQPRAFKNNQSLTTRSLLPEAREEYINSGLEDEIKENQYPPEQRLKSIPNKDLIVNQHSGKDGQNVSNLSAYDPRPVVTISEEQPTTSKNDGSQTTETLLQAAKEESITLDAEDKSEHDKVQPEQRSQVDPKNDSYANQHSENFETVQDLRNLQAGNNPNLEINGSQDGSLDLLNASELEKNQRRKFIRPNSQSQNRYENNLNLPSSKPIHNSDLKNYKTPTDANDFSENHDINAEYNRLFKRERFNQQTFHPTTTKNDDYQTEFPNVHSTANSIFQQNNINKETKILTEFQEESLDKFESNPWQAINQDDPGTHFASNSHFRTFPNKEIDLSSERLNVYPENFENVQTSTKNQDISNFADSFKGEFDIPLPYFVNDAWKEFNDGSPQSKSNAHYSNRPSNLPSNYDESTQLSNIFKTEIHEPNLHQHRLSNLEDQINKQIKDQGNSFSQFDSHEVSEDNGFVNQYLPRHAENSVPVVLDRPIKLNLEKEEKSLKTKSNDANLLIGEFRPANIPGNLNAGFNYPVGTVRESEGISFSNPKSPTGTHNQQAPETYQHKNNEEIQIRQQKIQQNPPGNIPFVHYDTKQKEGHLNPANDNKNNRFSTHNSPTGTHGRQSPETYLHENTKEIQIRQQQNQQNPSENTPFAYQDTKKQRKHQNTARDNNNNRFSNHNTLTGTHNQRTLEPTEEIQIRQQQNQQNVPENTSFANYDISQDNSHLSIANNNKNTRFYNPNSPPGAQIPQKFETRLHENTEEIQIRQQQNQQNPPKNTPLAYFATKEENSHLNTASDNKNTKFSNHNSPSGTHIQPGNKNILPGNTEEIPIRQQQNRQNLPEESSFDYYDREENKGHLNDKHVSDLQDPYSTSGIPIGPKLPLQTNLPSRIKSVHPPPLILKSEGIHHHNAGGNFQRPEHLPRNYGRPDKTFKTLERSPLHSKRDTATATVQFEMNVPSSANQYFKNT